MSKPERPPTIDDVSRAIKRALKAGREMNAIIHQYVEHMQELGIPIEIVETEQEDTANHGTVSRKEAVSKS